MINIPEKYKNAIKSMMKKDKLLILLIIGVIFLLINFPAKTKKNTTDTKENTTGEIEENSYVKNMEKRLFAATRHQRHSAAVQPDCFAAALWSGGCRRRVWGALLL